MLLNQIPELKTLKQKRKYITDLGLQYNKDINGYSKILVNGQGYGIHPKQHHFVEMIDVITAPYKHDVEPKTRKHKVVNIGTYFCRFYQSNLFVGVNDYIDFINEYGPNDYARFTRDHNGMQESAKVTNTTPKFKYKVFCTSNLMASYEEHGKYIIQPIMFVRSNPCGDRPSMVMHYELADWFCKSVAGAILQKNLEIVRNIQQGNNEMLVDRIDGTQVEQVKLPIKTHVIANTYELHHLKVLAGKSADKDGADPGALLRRYDIINSDKREEIIIELMKTICISKNSHGLIHKLWYSGINDLYKRQWPHALQNENNFKAVCAEYNLIGLDYKTFIADLK